MRPTSRRTRTANNRHAARLLAALWLLLLLLPGCASTRPTIKIGLIAPFEGAHRPLAYEALAAVKLALHERNAAGGVAGFGIELVALNDDGVPALAARQVAALAADPDVVAILGPWQIETAQAAAPRLRAAGLAAIIPAALPDADLAQAPTAFRLFAGDAALAAALALQLPAGAQVESAGPPVAWASPLLQRTTAEGPQVVILTGAAETVARQLTISPCVRTITACFAGPSLAEGIATARAGDAAEGLVWVTSLSPPDCQGRAADFCRAYRTAAGAEPGAFAALAYDATATLLAAIERSGQAERMQVMAALGAVELTGLSGPIRFDAQRSWEEAPARSYRVRERNPFR